jgi:hypothetical protein
MRSVQFPAETVEAGQQLAALGQPRQVDAVEEDVPAVDGVHLERGVGDPEVAGLTRGGAHDEAGVRILRGQVDPGRHTGHPRAEFPAQHRPERRPVALREPRHQRRGIHGRV